MFEGNDLSRCPTTSCAAIRGNDDRDDLPGPAVLAAPVLQGRQAADRGDPGAPRRLQGGRPATRAVELLELVGIPDPAAARRPVPARVLGRHAPARDDRDGARQRAEAADRRRADDRARRDRAGADPGAAGAICRRDSAWRS